MHGNVLTRMRTSLYDDRDNFEIRTSSFYDNTTNHVIIIIDKKTTTYVS